VSSSAKRLLLLGAIAVVALLLAGIATGAIGAALVQSKEDKTAGKTAEGLIPKPAVHLPAQTVFPSSERQYYEEFLAAEEKEKEGQPLTDDEHQVVKEGPFRGFKFLITNTILSSWITSVLLLLIFWLGARKAQLVPGRFQNVVEVIVEGLLNFVESVVGRERGRQLFPIIATIFLFVLFNAWMGLLPVYQSLGFIEDGHIQIHLLRPAGTDMNMPLALALVSFVFVEALGLRVLGLGYLGKFVRLGSLRRGLVGLVRLQFMEFFQGMIDFALGFLEAFSEFVRIISFTFRLFGNMTAGEILVLVSAFLASFVATTVVYGLELIVGAVQALIFAGLTLVFASVAITPHEAEEEHH